MLDHVLLFKREPENVNNKNVEYSSYLLAHKGSAFDISVVK